MVDGKEIDRLSLLFRCEGFFSGYASPEFAYSSRPDIYSQPGQAFRNINNTASNFSHDSRVKSQERSGLMIIKRIIESRLVKDGLDSVASAYSPGNGLG